MTARTRIARFMIPGLLIAAIVASGAGRGAAQESPGTLERRVKAAFLYKFTGYIEWPSQAFRDRRSPLVIGVAGDPTLVRLLRSLVDQQSAGVRPVEVRAVEDVPAAEGVHLLFVSARRTELLAPLREAGPRPTLLVSEVPDGLERGSMINFQVVDGRVRFAINLGAAQRSGLTLSSRLLAVAQSVVNGL